MKTEASANYFGSFEWEGKQVEFTVKVYGEAYYYPEKRVSGNPTMIESFEESGVDVKDFAVDELTIDGQWDDSNSCKMCCWYYDSKFKVK